MQALMRMNRPDSTERARIHRSTPKWCRMSHCINNAALAMRVARKEPEPDELSQVVPLKAHSQAKDELFLFFCMWVLAISSFFSAYLRTSILSSLRMAASIRS